MNLTNYPQRLREGTLAAAAHLPTEDKARMLNMMEAIIEGELSDDQIVDALMDDTLPVRYVPRIQEKAK